MIQFISELLVGCFILNRQDIFIFMKLFIFVFLMDFLKLFNSQGFLLEYFILIPIYRKHLSRKDISTEWQRLNEFCVSGMLQSQSNAEIPSMNFCMFFSLNTRVTLQDTVSSAVNNRLIWKIGKQSETTATWTHLIEQFR